MNFNGLTVEELEKLEASFFARALTVTDAGEVEKFLDLLREIRAAEGPVVDIKIRGLTPGSLIPVVKTLRSLIPGFGLADAKRLAESKDGTVLEKVAPKKARAIAAALTEAGSLVALVPQIDVSNMHEVSAWDA
jgi:ribosomal protein L7/L12